MIFGYDLDDWMDVHKCRRWAWTICDGCRHQKFSYPNEEVVERDCIKLGERISDLVIIHCDVREEWVDPFPGMPDDFPGIWVLSPTNLLEEGN